MFIFICIGGIFLSLPPFLAVEMCSFCIVGEGKNERDLWNEKQILNLNWKIKQKSHLFFFFLSSTSFSNWACDMIVYMPCQLLFGISDHPSSVRTGLFP